MNVACTSASRNNAADRMSSSEQTSTVFFLKVGEQITDYTHNFMKNIEDFKLSLESLKESLKVLNAKASEVEEQIKFPMGSCRRKRKREVEEWLRRVKYIENEVAELGNQVDSEGFIRNLMGGGKVVLLNEEAEMLAEKRQHFDNLQLDTYGTRGVELLTTRMVGKAFDRNFKEIWDFLEKREVSSIGIHGMGGVGKTALAKCINNELLKQSQLSVFWITVSQEFTIKSLQDKIACFLGLNFLNENDEDIRASRLHRALSEIKSSVFILDDLWENIELLKVGCPVSVECCRLIITTRSLEVCHQMRCQKVIAMETLDDDEAWKLFTETFAPEEELELDPHVEEAAKSMTRLCGGLPLGITTMAGKMRGVTSIHSWKTGLAELMESPTIQDGVYRTLKHSFDRLNHQSQCKAFNLFQRCFLYCSLYPRGYLPDSDKLVTKFISEGLVDGRKSRRAQVHMGHSVLDTLVDVCLLKACGTERVMMHDLVRGMALKISEGKYMVKMGEIPNKEEWTEDLEKVLLMHNDMTIIRDGTSPNCPKLSTLLLQSNSLRTIPDSFFSKMKRLSTLDLRDTLIRKLPEIISDLTSLEALFLEHCLYLKKVPYLGKLKALRELNLSHTAIMEVPHELQELLNLKVLKINASGLEMPPRDLLRKLSRLQVLKFPIHLHIPAEEIVNLREVGELRGRLNNVHAFNCFLKSRKHDAVYKVQVGQEHRYEEDFEEVVGGYDRRVCLNHCNLKNDKVLGRDIEVLVIVECEGLNKCLLDAFSPSSYPNSLQMLIIQKCEGIERVLTSSPESSSQFSTLERIALDELKDFKGLLIRNGQTGAAPAQSIFSSLKHLNIVDCNEIRKLGLPVSAAPNLEEITIIKCAKIEEVFEDDGEGCVARPKLKELDLDELPRLERLCNAKVICNSINYVFISKCPRMKKLPLHFDEVLPPSTRSSFHVEREWWESLEWENPRLPQLLQPLVCFWPIKFGCLS